MAAITPKFDKLRNPDLKKWMTFEFWVALFSTTAGHDHDGVNSKSLSPAAVIADNAVTNAKIAADAVGTSKILDASVTTAKIAPDAIDATLIADAAIQSEHIKAGAIVTAGIAADAVTNTLLANITRGSIKVGGAADAPTDLDAKTSGYILVGDGTDVKSVAVSGDVTLSAAGAVAVGATKITTAMLALAAAPIARAITAPVHAAAIAVTSSGYANIAILDAVETNTLADPTFAGQEITLVAISRAGTGQRTITAASAINQAGNTTILLNAAGETVILRGVTVGGGIKWRVVMNDGATLG